MRVAVQHHAAQVDSSGHVTGHDAGATLLRRLLRVLPEPILIGPGPRRCDGFDMLPLEFIDGERTVVVSMDVIDSVEVWRTLQENGCAAPRLMNFVWWNLSRYSGEVEQAALALSCALFPTFANSGRTATEVREVVARWTIPQLAEKSRVSWVNLGFRIEHVRPRDEPHLPVVLYPAIYLSDRKRPQLFIDVLERVHKRTPLRVEARLHESHLVAEPAMRMSSRDWIWVGPLMASRDSYWEALSHTTAFLATASEESYGLEYVEALAAGAVGVFPDLPWVQVILPPHYPFLYRSAAEAETLLHRAVTETAACRAELDACVGGSFLSWLQTNHDDDLFEQAVLDRIAEWFGEVDD